MLLENEEISIFLGREYDEEGYDILEPPSMNKLNEYEKTYQDFLLHMDAILDEIKEETFKRYIKYYAHYYENEEKSHMKPLHIDTKEKHFKQIKNIEYIRILDNGRIQILMRYLLDEEHGLEVLIKDSKVVDIGGIVETGY